MAEYVNAPIVSVPEDLLAQVYDYLQTNVPGWEPNPGNLDVWLAEAFAQIAAQVAETASDVPTSIFRWYGAKVANVPPVEATLATGEATWTLVDGAGYTIPLGTTVAFESGTGELIAFQTSREVVVEDGISVAAAVPVIATEPGAVGSGLNGDGQLLDPLDFVSSITLDAPTAGGADAESDEDYLNRLADELRLLSPRPILPEDFATLVRSRVPGIFRALALDGFDPSATAFTGDTTATSAVIANVSDPAGISVGSIISGAGIPTGAKVLSVDSETQVTLDQAATATATGVALTSTGSYENERTLTLSPVSSEGLPVSTQTKQEADDLLQSEREVNFQVFVVDPTYTPVDVDFTITVWPDFDAASVVAEAVAAVEDYLSPRAWGLPDFGNSRTWENEPKVRFLEVAQVIQNVEGVRYVDALTIDGGSGDVDLAGAAPMPEVGTVTGASS